MTIERTVKITECEYDALLAAFTLYQMHQEDYPALYPWQDVAAHGRIMSKWKEAGND